jgi:PQQ-like domain
MAAKRLVLLVAALASLLGLVTGLLIGKVTFGSTARTTETTARPLLPAPGEFRRIGLPGPPSDIAVTEDAVWVQAGRRESKSGPEGLYRIDKRTHVWRWIPGTDLANEVEAWQDAVFVSLCLAGCSSGSVSRLDPDTGAAVWRTPVGPSARGLVVGEGSVWMGSGGGLVRIDAQTGRVTGRFTDRCCFPIGVNRHAVWMTSSNGRSLLGIDPSTGRVKAEIDRPVRDACGGAVTESRVWVLDCGGSEQVLLRLWASGRVHKTYRLPEWAHMSASDDTAWLAAARVGPEDPGIRIRKLIPGVGAPWMVLRLGFDPHGPHFGSGPFGTADARVIREGDTLWIADYVDADVIRFHLLPE